VFTFSLPYVITPVFFMGARKDGYSNPAFVFGEFNLQAPKEHFYEKTDPQRDRGPDSLSPGKTHRGT
jgi:hypothetical protein